MVSTLIQACCSIYRIKNILVIFCIISILITCFSFSQSNADDLDPHYRFSGVQAPGSPYRNTWGAYQTDLFSGSFNYQYKIEVPPGTNGLTPNLSISYNSHSAKGKAGWVGSGWEIPVTYIQRNIQYTRKDTSDDTFELYMEGAKHDLLYVPSDGTYHTNVESYYKIEKKTGASTDTGEYWIVTSKNGTEYRFGYNSDSENIVSSTDPTVHFVWRWSLDRIKDSNGNCIYFTYSENPTVNDRGAVYLNKVEYNNDKKRLIEFILEDSDKPDMYLTIEQGSEAIEAKRLKEIRVSVDGKLARRYSLIYDVNKAQNRSLLASITQFGNDGTSMLPPIKFQYNSLNQAFGDEQNWSTPGERWIRANSDSNVVVDTFDINGDGLPDLVSFDNDHWDIWFNNGTGFVSDNKKWPVPSDWYIRNVRKWEGGSSDPAPNTKSAPIDMDGDGYVDFAWADKDTTITVRRNMGNVENGFSSVQQWAVPASVCIRDVQRPYNQAANVQEELFDINGDGRPDVVEQADDYHWRIWRNTGTGFTYYDTWQVFHGSAWIEDFTRGVANVQVTHIDMNGDGLPDIVNANGNTWTIWINTGSGFISGGYWHTAYDNYTTDLDATGNIKRDLIDINGDGLPDIVNPPTGNGSWEVQLNTGKGFTDIIHWSSSITDGFTRDETRDGQTRRDVFDIDGDGVPDIVRQDGNSWKISKNLSGTADLLSNVVDMLGGQISISYVSSAKFVNTRLPFNYWLVSSVTSNNGMSGPHALTATANYSYSQGLYDFPTREFRGFGKIAETRADGSKVLHYFHQDEARKGKEYKSETKSNSDLPFASTENTWTGLSSNGVYVPRLDRTDSSTFDGIATNPKVIRTEFQNYDAYGNVCLTARYGDLAATGDETYEYKEFVYNTNEWIVDRLKHSYISGSPSGPKLREEWFYYDGASLDTAPTAGNLTKEEHYLDTGGNPVTSYSYDSYGNRTSTTDPEGRVTTIEYDTTFNTFPRITHGPLGHTWIRDFDPVNGKLSQETDPNGYITKYLYDTFSRKIKEIKPYDTEQSPTTLIQYSVNGTAPAQVIVSKRENAGQSGTLDTIQFVDGFGQLVQSRSELWYPYAQIIADVFYDKMRRVVGQTNPYLTIMVSQNYSTPNTSIPTTSFIYDTLDRPVQILNPDSTTVSRVFDHWMVIETDENGHAKTYTYDAFQRLKTVVEKNSGASYTTTYEYNALGELLRIVDHLGKMSIMQYDSLGRKILMTDPNLGTWKYGYDRVGNLTSQTDARNIQTKFDYDSLNRKRHATSPNRTWEFLYDAGTKGTLSSVFEWDSNHQCVHNKGWIYDQRLRRTGEQLIYDDRTWVTKWSYDSMDRIVSRTNPDGQIVTFNYNAQGKLASIPSVINTLQYDPAGNTTLKTYANGTSTTYSYDNPRMRLTGISTPGLQNLSYSYDGVGNIKTIADGVSGRTESFSYDDLDRLTQAGDSGYSSSYQFNAVGNILSHTKDGATTQFIYDTAKPHAVSSMGVPLPVVGSFIINDGSGSTSNRQVTLKNVSFGNPTNYMASEDAAFQGASWQPYSASPTFTLSSGSGRKTVYLKVKNNDGESTAKSSEIQLQVGAALKVTITPDSANTAGAQWSVDSGGWNNTGATVSGLSLGSHTVHFKQINGWIAPTDQTTNIQDGQTAAVAGIYTQLGSLSVNILPQAAIATGAQWRVDGGTWQNSGATASNLSDGSHTVQFKDVTGFSKPADQQISIKGGQSTSLSFNYTPQNGNASLQVTLSPEAPIKIGAGWRVDGGNWQISGTKISGLSAGGHTVQFKHVTGWTEPADQIVTTQNGQTTALTFSYVPLTGTKSLIVTLLPPNAVSAGVQWSVDGGEWQNSGDKASDLVTGDHTVQFKQINGWKQPADQIVTTKDDVTRASFTYCKDLTPILILLCD